jgi:predicted O-methyltransferase YrrM
MTAQASATENFDDVLAALADVNGWLTDGQARRLHDNARALAPGSRIVEIGSYQGRSTIVLARAAGENAAVIAIDSHDGNNRGPQQVRGEYEEGHADYEIFHENLRRAGVQDRVQHVRARSQDALALVHGTVDLLYIDGAHQYRAARDDIRHWGARVRDDGTMLIHDGFSSIGVTLALLHVMALSDGWHYVGRSRSMVEYRRRPSSRAANLRAHAASLPWFVRNVAIKVALVTRQYWVCRALGHEGRRWPY